MLMVLRHLLLVALLMLGLVAACSSPAQASPESGAVAADHLLTVAINNVDQPGVEKLLDPEFSWTDRTGKTRSKSEILPALASLASESHPDVKIIATVPVLSLHANTRIPPQNPSS